MSDSNLQVINMNKIHIPQPFEDVRIGNDLMIRYGHDNLYPNYLLKLYNECPIHSAIINSKASYVIGNGVKTIKGDDINTNVNAQDSFNEFVSKCIKDYLIFNYFAVEVIYNSFNQPFEYHFIPAQSIRTNKSKTQFWYCEDWCYSQNVIKYQRFSTTQTDDTTSKIFFFDGYNPSVQQVYSKPDYYGSIKSIVTDISIRDFNLNNIKNTFSASHIITFFIGDPDEEVKDAVNTDLQDMFTGESGQKMVVNFMSKDGVKPDVQQLSGNMDWANAYVETAKNVSDDILRGHSITSPALFGVKTEGQIGATTEMESAYEIFKNTYVINKRIELEGAFNTLFTGSITVTSKVMFTDKPLFNSVMKDLLKSQIFTINELRAEVGMPPLAQGDTFIADPTNKQQQVNDPTNQQMDSNKKKVQSRKLVEDDFESIAHLGMGKDDFELVFALQFDKESDIADFVLKNDIKHLTIDQIQKLMQDDGLNVSSNDIETALESLVTAKVIAVDKVEGKANIKPATVNKIPNSAPVSVMYEYEKKPDVSGDILIKTSRSFCVKLVDNNRYYSRADIQSMSGIFGYDVFKFCGGYYYDPDSDTTTPSCRHQWKRVVVRKKNNLESND